MWNIEPSLRSQRTVNPIFQTLAQIKLPENFHKPTYSLTIGDPAKFPEFAPDPVVTEEVNKQLLAGTGNGYMNSSGPQAAREALATRFSYDNIQLAWDDVFIDIGGVGTMHTVLQTFLDPGDNLLIPSPGFTLFCAMANNLGAETKNYRLDPDREWEVDLAHLDSVADDRTKLVVIVNPSNPCGTIFSREHLLEILQWASRRKICLLADEVYTGMTFGKPYYPLGSLTDDVPVITITALSKPYLVPGWRCGWILVYDKYKRCDEIKKGLQLVKDMLLHPSPFIANAIPGILQRISPEYMQNLMSKVQPKAAAVFERVQAIPALQMYMPDGVFYGYVRVDCSQLQDVNSSLEFAQRFAQEQGVVVMPAEAFMSEGGFRIVMFNPLEELLECCNRLAEFVQAHLKK